MRFLSRALTVLDRVLRFEGGQGGISQMELATPLQPVFDVSRLSEIRAVDTGFYGFFPVNNTNIHAGADTVETDLYPYTEMATVGIPTEGMTLWMMYMGVFADAAIISSGQVTVYNGGQIGQGWAPSRGYRLFGVDGQVTVSDDATYPVAGRNGAANGNPYLQRMPFPVPPGSRVHFRSVSTGAGLITFSGELYVTPIGVLPPFMI